MVPTTVTLALTFAMLAVPAALADPGGQPNENALFGICNAWSHNGNGQANGNAENAPPFQWLQDEAQENGQSVAEFCAQVAHPGNGNGNGNGNSGNGNGNGGPAP